MDKTEETAADLATATAMDWETAAAHIGVATHGREAIEVETAPDSTTDQDSTTARGMNTSLATTPDLATAEGDLATAAEEEHVTDTGRNLIKEMEVLLIAPTTYSRKTMGLGHRTGRR